MEKYELNSFAWLPFNKQKLEELISQKAHQHNYVVFDWDFTCVFYDTQDSLFSYQIANLVFRLSPTMFSKVIRQNIPQNIPLGVSNSKGIILTADMLSKDLDSLYLFLYNSYEKLNGNLSLHDVKNTKEFTDFYTKFFLLMIASHSISKTDLAQIVSTGFNLNEYNTMAENSIDASLNLAIEKRLLISSNTGYAGECSVFEPRGIRIQKEIQNLFNAFRENGIEIYICTASQIDNIRIFASKSKYGYGVKLENIFGRRRVMDRKNCFTVEDDLTYGYTYSEGKAKTIETMIMPKHHNKPPILIAGDSDGDFYMMDKFKKESMLLIFDRNQNKSMKIYPLYKNGLEQRGNINTNILVQSIDNLKSSFTV